MTATDDAISLREYLDREILSVRREIANLADGGRAARAGDCRIRIAAEPVKTRIAATIGPMTVGALIALAAFFGGSAWQAVEPIQYGYSGLSVQVYETPTEDAAIRMVMIVSPTPEPTVFATVTPLPTATRTPDVMPPCLPGKATPGARCLATLPTSTPAAPTPIPLCTLPIERMVVGTTCIYPRT